MWFGPQHLISGCRNLSTTASPCKLVSPVCLSRHNIDNLLSGVAPSAANTAFVVSALSLQTVVQDTEAFLSIENSLTLTSSDVPAAFHAVHTYKQSEYE